VESICASLCIKPENLHLFHQVHGDRIVIVDKQTDNTIQDADALITCEPGICIAVKTADCVPILLYAPDREVVAAVHAGWRGTVQRIVAKVVEQMINQFGCDPTRIRAVIGPSIGQKAFEVGEEVVEAFLSAGINHLSLYERNPQTGKMHIDLKQANRLQLLEAGIDSSHIEISDSCTYTHHPIFFSARREGAKCGRMLTGIMIKNKPI
jgi:YfiH family protein